MNQGFPHLDRSRFSRAPADESSKMPEQRDDAGAVLVEYAALISLILAVAFLAVQAFGGGVLGLFEAARDVMP